VILTMIRDLENLKVTKVQNAIENGQK